MIKAPPQETDFDSERDYERAMQEFFMSLTPSEWDEYLEPENEDYEADNELGKEA
jgi:hypothetical protein